MSKVSFVVAGTFGSALAMSSDVAVNPVSTEVSGLIVRLERDAVHDRIMFPQLFTANTTVQLAPNDPLYANQWHYFSPIGGIS